MGAGAAKRILVGYDGSVAAGAALQAAAQLIPQAHAWTVNLWMPPHASDALRRRLWTGTGGLNGFINAIEREGAVEAERLAETGAILARAAGWTAEPLVERILGGEAVEFGRRASGSTPCRIYIKTI